MARLHHAAVILSAAERHARLLSLHQAVLGGSREALNAVVELLLPVLQAKVHTAFRMVSADVATDAATDALMDYAVRPGSFNPSHGVALERFLYHAAWRNMSDAWRATTIRRAREVQSTADFNSLAAPQTADATGSASDHVDLAGLISRVPLTGVEQEALRLVLMGERRTAVLATALRVDGGSRAEQRRR